MKPVVKWAGGKTQLLRHIDALLPASFNHYFEPFFGGGALLLKLSSRASTVNDINPELVNMYVHIWKGGYKMNEVFETVAEVLEELRNEAEERKSRQSTEGRYVFNNIR